MVVAVPALGQHVLVARVVGLLIDHPAATVHADGFAAGEVGVHVGAVTVALVVTPLEVPALVEDDLETAGGRNVMQHYTIVPQTQASRHYHV